jgi:predicted DNA-binding transcriptional regulator YafY
MKRSSRNRRPAVHITLGRAARLYRLVMLVAGTPKSRESVLAELAIGLRTFYRELELLDRCGVRIERKDRLYALFTAATEAEGLLPFPDPQLSFAEIRELARNPGEAGQRLAALLASVVSPPPPAKKKTARSRKAAKNRENG